MQRLDPAEHGRERLVGDAGQVVNRLLRHQRATRGVDREPELHGSRILGAVPLLQHPRPHPARRADLGDLLEEVDVARDVEGEAGSKLVDMEATADQLVDVDPGDAESEGHLLRCGDALLAQIVHVDRGVVPLGHVTGAVLHHVGAEPDRQVQRAGRPEAAVAEMDRVVLDRAPQARDVVTTVLGHRHVLGHGHCRHR